MANRAFQDLFGASPSHPDSDQDHDHEEEDDHGEGQAGSAHLKFFELANARSVRYTLATGEGEVCVEQRSGEGAGPSSNGIVWETAFTLATYLERCVLKSHKRRKRKRAALSVVELGSGCGLLGLVLAHSGCHVVLTEQESALAHLRGNVSRNQPDPPSARVMPLTWGNPDHCRHVLAACEGKVDMVVATDVVFHHSLVEPLVASMQELIGAGTVAWVCVQERDPKAHRCFTQLIARVFRVERVDPSNVPGLGFVPELDILLLKLTRLSPPPA